VVEVAVGRRPDVARELVARDCAVTATDVVEREVPDGVSFVVDDVTDPDPDVYAGCDCVYGLNLPPELHRPAWAVARECGADFLFTTLGGDQPEIPVEREMLPEGETLFVARDRDP
jgi:uncharacterized UPF0146 family protein